MACCCPRNELSKRYRQGGKTRLPLERKQPYKLDQSQPRVTFEPDFVTYNYDNRQYFGNSISSWSTTMPGGYKDSKLFDDNKELVYTVGSHEAQEILSGVTYQMVFITAAGNYSADTAKVVAQIGTHLPGCWLPQTCIFADASRIFFNGWTLPVPKGTWTSSS